MFGLQPLRHISTLPAAADCRPDTAGPQSTHSCPSPRRSVMRQKATSGCVIGIAIFLYSRYAFSSRLTSSRNRQSVPSAMIFCGVDLMKRASRRRSA